MKVTLNQEKRAQHVQSSKYIESPRYPMYGIRPNMNDIAIRLSIQVLTVLCATVGPKCVLYIGGAACDRCWTGIGTPQDRVSFFKGMR